jgi:ABC-type nitrate/sulfonate/bicarbonate transport system permease component
VFPILLNTIDGVRSVDPGLEDVGRSFRLTRRQRVLAIQLPSAAPAIFAGMRIALAVAFVLMIVSEAVGATNGIGYVTFQAESNFDTPTMWAGMLLLAFMGALFNLIFVLIEARLLRWHYRSKGE